MILGAFLVGLVLVLAALVFVVVRAIGLWRQAKHTSSAFGEQAAAFEEKTARTEQLLAENEEAAAELQVALERLRVSRAKLQVLLRAVEQAQARVRWLRTYLPV